jgi:hypothetical protein
MLNPKAITTKIGKRTHKEEYPYLIESCLKISKGLYCKLNIIKSEIQNGYQNKLDL